MTNSATMPMLIILIVIISFFVIFEYTRRIRRFFARYKYFKMELERASWDEKPFWSKKILKEYVSLIPFVGIIFTKRKKRKE